MMNISKRKAYLNAKLVLAITALIMIKSISFVKEKLSNLVDLVFDMTISEEISSQK